MRVWHLSGLNVLLGNKYLYFGHPKFTPLYPPASVGRDFWVYSVCSIYNKYLASQLLKTVQRKRNVLKHPFYVKLYLTFSYLAQLVIITKPIL